MATKREPSHDVASDADALLARAVAVGERLLARGLLLATAESCTAGGVAYAITQVAGSSAWFDRGFVTYTNTAKCELLGVPEVLLAAHGAVSEPVVDAMARGALVASEAQVAVAVSGIAGPGGGTAAKPVGTVCFAWALADPDDAAPARIALRTAHLPGDRAAVRTAAIRLALDGLLALLPPPGIRA
jgi:nicotinamide-nucleotide amidase